MIKLIAFFAVLLGLAFGFAQLAETPGHLLLQFGETELRVSLLVGLLALVATLVAMMVLWTLLRLIFRLPSLIGLANRMRRQARGLNAVSRGLVAVGVGDQRLAQRFAGESARLIGNEPLALLLKAQSAQLSGDAKGAEAAFKAMLDKPETAGLGLRGLYVEAERRGDREGARLFVEEAYRRGPDAGWAGQALLGFRAGAQDWTGAIGIVDQSVSRRLVDRDTGKAQRAVLLAAAARQALERSPDEALQLAQEALRINPGLVPAAEIAARRFSARGDFSKASKILEAAWKQNPHPDLAEAYLGVRQGDSTLDRFKRARALAKLAPSARESRFAVARAAIDAREFAAAREALEALVMEKPTARACLLMAELEEIESSNQGLVRAWLARASRAPRDPAWVADGVVSDDWAPVSPATGQIGAFVWAEPPQPSEHALRARIDADRFEEYHPEPPAVLTVEPVTVEPVAAAAPEPAPAIPAMEAPPEPKAALEGGAVPIIPDDPGVEPGAPKPKSRFRLFG